MQKSKKTQEKINQQNSHESNTNSKLIQVQKEQINSQSVIQKSRVSNIIFKKEFSHSQKEQIIQKVKKIYKQKEWRFFFSQGFIQSNPTTLFENSQTILIERLTLHYCKNQNLLKSLKCVNFPRLRYLSLPGNNIKSWQLLNTIDLQSVQGMDLSQNFPSNIKPLIKANFNKINLVTLPNMIVDGSWEILRRSSFTQTFSQLSIDFDKNVNIYPFLLSLMFKQKKWNPYTNRITVHGPLISTKNEKLIKKLVSKRSNIGQLSNWPLSLYDIQI